MKLFTTRLLRFLQGHATALSTVEIQGRNVLAAALCVFGVVLIDSARSSLPHGCQAWGAVLLDLGSRSNGLHFQIGRWSTGSAFTPSLNRPQPSVGTMFVGTVQGLGIQFFLLAFCFRGNRVALVLTRLLAGLYGFLLAALIVLIAVNRWPVPLHTVPAYVDAVESTVKVLGIGFVCWALFVSRSVRTFLRRQEARPILPSLLPV